jgi:hypothetical protein
MSNELHKPQRYVQSARVRVISALVLLALGVMGGALYKALAPRVDCITFYPADYPGLTMAYSFCGEEVSFPSDIPNTRGAVSGEYIHILTGSPEQPTVLVPRAQIRRPEIGDLPAFDTPSATVLVRDFDNESSPFMADIYGAVHWFKPQPVPCCDFAIEPAALASARRIDDASQGAEIFRLDLRTGIISNEPGYYVEFGASQNLGLTNTTYVNNWRSYLGFDNGLISSNTVADMADLRLQWNLPRSVFTATQGFKLNVLGGDDPNLRIRMNAVFSRNQLINGSVDAFTTQIYGWAGGCVQE